jgi:hypothetical protein
MRTNFLWDIRWLIFFLQLLVGNRVHKIVEVGLNRKKKRPLDYLDALQMD